MQDRIKDLRKKLKLTQVEFGERIGVKGNTITNYENGLRNPSDAVILSICREFGVNESWLRTGEGEPFVPTPTTEFDRLANKYDLDDLEKKILSAYLDLGDDQRTVFQGFLKTLAERHALEPQDAPEEDNIRWITHYLVRASAGTGNFLDESASTRFAYKVGTVPDGAQYAVTVSGDSMEPDFHNGDIVFVQKVEELSPGDIGLFVVRGDVFIKELGHGELLSHNPAYPPIKLHDGERVYTLGKVLGRADGDTASSASTTPSREK